MEHSQFNILALNCSKNMYFN